MRLYPCHQFHRTERLNNVIICPEPQPLDLIDIFFSRRYKQDRNIRLPPDLAADLKPVFPRQHKIQYNGGICVLLESFHTAIPVCLYICLHTFGKQIVTLKICNKLVVLNDKYFFHC